jgi:hypothetical protein
MGIREYIQKRRGRYLAQVLDEFEADIVPLLPEGSEPAVTKFKASVRRKFNALATDSYEIASVGNNVALNGVALDLRESLDPTSHTE